MGDKVVVMDFAPSGKLATKFRPEEFTGVDKKGTELLVESDKSGVQYRRNVVHTKRLPAATGEKSDEVPDEVNSGIKRQAGAGLAEELGRPKRKINKPVRFQ